MSQKNKRRNYFIDKSFQRNFILKFCAITILASAIIGAILFLLSRGSTTVAIENTNVTVKTTADFILPLIIQTLILVTIFSAISVCWLTLFVSHKIAGPLYRLRREIEKLEKGNLDLDLNIRAGDQVENLAVSLSRMADSLKEKVESLKSEFSGIKHSLDNITSPELTDKLNKIEGILNYFKV